jgi:hypothetical protein
MLDHVGIEVSDFEGAAGFGKDTEHGPKPFFWIGSRGRSTVSGAHVCFGARTPELVDASTPPR